MLIIANCLLLAQLDLVIDAALMNIPIICIRQHWQQSKFKNIINLQLTNLKQRKFEIYKRCSRKESIININYIV